MSSAIILMNKQGVAIAADSAVTLGNRKAFFNTQKIFPIGDLPLAIITVGDTQIGSIPFDLIIEGFSAYIKKHQIIKENLFDYKEVLFDYLKGAYFYYKFDEQEETYVIRCFRKIFYDIKNEISKDHGELILSTKAFQKAYEEIKRFFAEDPLFHLRIKNPFNLNNIKSKNKEISHNAYMSFFDERDYEKYPINDIDEEYIKLAEKIYLEFSSSHYYHSNNEVEIAMTGFGSNELFPSLMRFSIHGIVEKQIIYSNIGVDYVIKNGYSRRIVYLGQKNVAEAILEGYSYETEIIIRNAFRWSLEENLKNQLKSNEYNSEIETNLIEKIVKESFERILKENKKVWEPIWNSVQHMPLLDMCSFAEGLINIQSLRSRYEADSESNNTVGGPIHVAKISLNEGVTWFKKNKGI
jgi:hypothetical protein